jgi:hypothetical protein
MSIVFIACSWADIVQSHDNDIYNCRNLPVSNASKQGHVCHFLISKPIPVITYTVQEASSRIYLL